MKKLLLFEFASSRARKWNAKMLLCLFVLLAVANTGFAQKVWNGSVSSDFLDDNNWTGTGNHRIEGRFANNPVLSADFPGGWINLELRNDAFLTTAGSMLPSPAQYWNGTLTIIGGTTNVRNNLYLGDNATAAENIPTINIETGGAFNVKNYFLIGQRQPGIVNVNGGVLTHDGYDIAIGNYPQYAGCEGALNINAGEAHIRAGKLNVSTKGTLNVNGGVINVAAGKTRIVRDVNLNGGMFKMLAGNSAINAADDTFQGTVNFAGGTLDVEGSLDINACTVHLENGLINFSAAGALTVNGTSVVNIGKEGKIVLMGDQTAAMAAYITANTIKLSDQAVLDGCVMKNLYNATTDKTIVFAWSSKQILGTYQKMDGGFEAQFGRLATVSGYVPSISDWTTAGVVVGDIDATGTKARSGENCLSYTISSGGRYVLAPQMEPAPAQSTSYVIQFYYNSNTDPVVNGLNAAFYSDARRISGISAGDITPSFSANSWLKVAKVVSSAGGTIFGTPWAGIRDGNGAVAALVDDYVIYEGTEVDVTAPDAATAAKAVVNGSTMNVSWNAPATGVDGGGYVVVRYTNTVNDDNDPNQNGIYAIGNTITNGTDALVGQVQYIGTGTSYTDKTIAADTKYYYKVYTVDKAFNYSEEAVGSNNSAPVTVADAIAVAKGGTATDLTDGSSSLVANDTDQDNDTLSAEVVTNPVNGTLTLNLDGTFSYVHNGSATTSDSFTYRAYDGTDYGNVVTVTIEVSNAPLSLVYESPNVFTKGSAITALTPVIGGGTPTSYTVVPTLPAGLSIDTDGIISGTPTVLLTETEFTVTGSNTKGSASGTVTITINDVAPSALTYSTPNVFTKGSAITALTPSANGGTVIEYVVAPSLPAGLSMDAVTGVISGTPTDLSVAADYVVTASNTGGSTTATISITVNDVAPSALSYTTPNVYTIETEIEALNPTISGGPVVAYSIEPALPVGLSFDETTGVISGTPTDITPVADYVVTATNSGGSTTATISIDVNDFVLTGFAYETPQVLTKGVIVKGISSVIEKGTPLSYSVSPALPAGLSLDTATGVISGTPTAITAAANYTVTAVNEISSADFTIAITVNDVAPYNLTYYGVGTLKNGRTAEPMVPTVSGGPVVSYSISPSLPAGLSFDTATGVISGTPTAVTAESNYEVTATNTGGSDVSTVTIEVVDISIKPSQIFSPNGDGINDFWTVPYIAEYPRTMVRVFNTNGVQVFHTFNYNNDWNGKDENSNQDLPMGSYLYQIDLGFDGTIDAQGWLYISK